MRNLLMFFILGNLAFGRECINRTYTIKQGDTLATISKSIYGESASWSILFDNNRDKIEKPYKITIGDEIEIPCIDDIQPQKDNIQKEISKKELEEVKIEKVKEVKKSIKIDIVSTTTLHPFMENSLSHNNMLTDIVKESLDTFDNVDYSIEYIENRDIHPTLLEKKKYALSIGWHKPNIVDNSDNNIYSDPLFHTITTLYRRKNDNHKIKESKDIYGTKICRPKGWFSFDLLNQGLIDGKNITLVRKATPEICFSNLKDGKVDFVSLTSFVGDRTMKKMGLSRYVESIKRFSTIVELTVISHKENSDGAFYIIKFNQGLEKLTQSGRLEAIQSKYLKEFYDNIKY